MIPDSLRSNAATRSLEIAWPDGTRSTLSHRLLRSECRCALCLQAARSGTAAPVAPDISLVRIEPCGAGAVHLGFSDGHARGIYPFAYLRALGGRAL